jgi:hypothetical protein
MRMKVIGFIKEVDNEDMVNIVENWPKKDTVYIGENIRCSVNVTRTIYHGKQWMFYKSRQIIVANDDLTNQILESSEKAFLDLNNAELEISRLKDDLLNKEEQFNKTFTEISNMSLWKRLKFLFTKEL